MNRRGFLKGVAFSTVGAVISGHFPSEVPSGTDTPSAFGLTTSKPQDTEGLWETAFCVPSHLVLDNLSIEAKISGVHEHVISHVISKDAHYVMFNEKDIPMRAGSYDGGLSRKKIRTRQKKG